MNLKIDKDIMAKVVSKSVAAGVFLPHNQPPTLRELAQDFDSWPFSHDHCPVCDALREDQPNSRANEISPEQQLRNVAGALLDHTEIESESNGQGYAATMDVIALTGRQLAEMVIAYLNGDLSPIDAGDLPF